MEKLTFREVKTPQEFRQGEDAEVICDVISSPVPAVSWFYKNKEITSEPNSIFQVLPTNNLQILRVSKADEGVYRCEARVEARGEIDFRDIVVLVNVPPVLSVPQQSFNATADYQESVTFTCITSGSPDPQVTWYCSFRYKLHRACELATQNVFAAQSKMKGWFDKKAMVRQFKPEDKVLVFLPIPGSSFQARYSGPYVIKKRVSDRDYIVATPDRARHSRLCHINMIKPYYDREQLNKPSSGDVNTVLALTNAECSPALCLPLSNALQVRDPSVSPFGAETVLEAYVPSQTHVLQHDIDVGDNTPIKQHPYRVNPEKCSLCCSSQIDTTETGSSTSSFRLEYKLQQVQPHITQLRNVTAVEGNAAMISCTAEGEPLPEISWRRASDGQTFTDGDKSQDGRVEVRGRQGKSMLTISGVRLSDWGRFDCEALSRIGGHQKSMFLDIEYAPKFQTNQTIFYSWEGNPVNISCDMKSNPPATMLWRRDRFTISSQGTSNIRIHTTEGRSLLEVTPVSDRDFGRYNCTARNNIGTRYQEFILAQADIPSHPYSVRLTAVSQRLATVTFIKPDSHGGVPISYYIINYKDTSSQDWRTVRSHGVQSTVVLANLEPNTTYEVRVAAVNGKGQGDFSHTETFQTLPIREPSPPTVHGQRGIGKAYRLGLIKQDDGGMPIVEYILKYKTDKEEQWMTKLVPGMNDFALLQPLQWNTRYNVEITARNVKGLSEPTFFQFLMPQKPDITADSLFSGLGLGTVVGLGVAVLLLLLVLVDVSCFFLRQCGLLMCITRKLCSKNTTSGKSKELEEGKAAYLVDGSKEPIVEMRTEEERITNQEDGSPVHEPNETTPLTEPE
ncbi:neural cell adhesion molecule 2-like [Sinocyclocheilus anshuiensis]|uniref:neural cell adhesion molecule 2-like n=1 Tax=Sinocyclocheilus anshuiensis TaxID=1608454 RepID=UPI0007B9F9B4|nr:PREDICTED: neural cell adhesion molecule 2-like [Sinocyclocheilus anshuiensis]